MRVIIGQAQRELILKHLRPGSRVLEWGSGGSTLWLADRLPEGASLTSVEHDAAWHQRVRWYLNTGGGRDRSNVRLLTIPPTGPVGTNATIEEEREESLTDYIRAVPDDERFDVIIVDGYARNACLRRAVRLLAPGPESTVFLHDAHRDWYDPGKQVFTARGTIGSCPDYPGPLLWWGGHGAEDPRSSKGACPLVISYYTLGTPYEQEVEGLKQSVRELELDHDIRGVDSLGSWERNCARKARFVLDMARQHDRPVLWVDADAVIRRPPLLLAGAEPDFAVYRAHGWQLASGTVYFNRTEPAQALLAAWVRHCEAEPGVWDQIHLDTAWEEVTATRPLRTMWLPQTYTKIFDAAPDSDGPVGATHANHEPVIEHFQASRRLKRQVSTIETVRVMASPSDELVAARRACRPRRAWYDERFVVRTAPPPPEAWARPLTAT